MHKDILVDLQGCIDNYALKAVAESLFEFCDSNNITLEDAIKMYIDLHPNLTGR